VQVITDDLEGCDDVDTFGVLVSNNLVWALKNEFHLNERL
jgi:hypothetical protein